MDELTKKYRLSLYEEVIELSSKKIYVVKSSLDDKIYIKKILSTDNYQIYKKIKALNIKNIPQIYEIIKIDEELIIIEEYINGNSLKEILEKSKSLDKFTTIKYILDLIEILQALYCGGDNIIHRDIKPSNIMINNDGILKLIDFDISRIHKKEKSTDTNILGTYGYAAPEQFGFNQSDIRTDIYSLGATMNILLSGSLPVEKLYEGDLSKVISKCIEFDPRKRYQNLDDLKDDLIKNLRKDKMIDSRYKEDYDKYRSRNLPGFRSNNIIGVISTIWYSLLFLALVGFLDQEAISSDRLNNIGFSVLLFTLTILYGNYRNISKSLVILRSENKFIKVFGYIFYTVIIIFLYDKFF